jgi:hypothetical protein
MAERRQPPGARRAAFPFVRPRSKQTRTRSRRVTRRLQYGCRNPWCQVSRCVIHCGSRTLGGLVSPTRRPVNTEVAAATAHRGERRAAERHSGAVASARTVDGSRAVAVSKEPPASRDLQCSCLADPLVGSSDGEGARRVGAVTRDLWGNCSLLRRSIAVGFARGTRAARVASTVVSRSAAQDRSGGARFVCLGKDYHYECSALSTVP